MTDSSQSHWDGVYGVKAEDAVSWYEPAPTLSLDLVARIGAPMDAAVIDIGGGLSRLADELVAAGHTDVTVLDISEEAIRKRGERGGPVRGIVADITAWGPERRYGVWHDRAALHFLTREEDRAAYRRALIEGLTHDGEAIIATFAPDGPERCSGLQVRRYGREDIEGFLGEAFVVVESGVFDHVTPSGATQKFHFARLRRRA